MFSKDEIQNIETELDSLKLQSNPEYRKKHFNNLLKDFKGYLKDNHALILERYYTNIGITRGAAFGIIAGIINGYRFGKSLGIALGIGVGMLIGAFIGRKRDAQAKAKGNVL